MTGIFNDTEFTPIQNAAFKTLKYISFTFFVEV